MAAERFEDRHRELREAVQQAGAAYRADDGPAGRVLSSSVKLADFHERTGQLVDDLVVAVRESLDYDVSVAVPGNQAAEYLRRDAAVRTKLAALDEASARG